MELDFDQSKIALVDIGSVQPNPWNPKEKDTKEFAKIVKSIKVNGLKGIILVRELAKDKYEIIDGEQRWTAAKEIGYPQINIYNEGKMSDQKAKELTVWYQQQVPFERVAEAHLVRDMVLAYHNEETLPYTSDEIHELQLLADFDFDQYKDEPPNPDEEVKNLSFKLTKEEFTLAWDFFNRADQSKEEILMDLLNANL